jgi:5-formyltetrahydrofolate cyclo-ligase
MDEITTHKKRLRADAKIARASAFARHGSAASEALATHGLDFVRPATAAAISSFSAIGNEINPQPLMLRLAASGHPLALPAMQGKTEPLVFRTWRPGDQMAPAVWGISEPLASSPAVEPDIVLVPLLAFDVRGFRLGYGGGFYDRTLARLRAMKPIVAIGIAYDEQRLDAVPHQGYDQPLDWVLTPSGPLQCFGR